MGNPCHFKHFKPMSDKEDGCYFERLHHKMLFIFSHALRSMGILPLCGKRMWRFCGCITWMFCNFSSHALRTMSILLYIGGDVHCINQVPSNDTYLIPSALLLGGIPILFQRKKRMWSFILLGTKPFVGLSFRGYFTPFLTV